jgi:hypothetical protein
MAANIIDCYPELIRENTLKTLTRIHELYCYTLLQGLDLNLNRFFSSSLAWFKNPIQNTRARDCESVYDQMHPVEQ